jgi:hypothetical protein
MPLTPASIVSRTEGLMSTSLGEDLVILNPATDNYIGLDEIGRRVWDLLATPEPVEDLCLRLSREYRGNPQQISADILDFLNEMAAEGLVYVAGA